jgi:PAS domain S-box-containing protein
MPPYEEAVATTPANVVPIRADLERPTDHTRLTPQERNAFEEIAAALRHRVLDEPVVEAEPETSAVPEPMEPETSNDGPAAAETTEPTSVVELFPEALAEETEPAASAGPAGAPKTAVRNDSPAEESAHQQSSLEAPMAEEPLPEEAAPEEPVVDPEDGALIEAAEETDARAEPAGESELPESQAGPRAAEAAERRAATRAKFSESETQRRLREMTAILDTATDGVIVLDGNGTIESLNASAEALFGLEAHEMQGTDFGELLTPGKPAISARLPLRPEGQRGRQPAQRRARGRGARRRGLHPAVHDDGAYLGRGRWAVLRGAARHHALEANRGGARGRQARGRNRVEPEIGVSGSREP